LTERDKEKPWILQTNEYMAVIIPATQKAFVFRVRAVVNDSWHRILYGTLPGLTAGTTMASYITTTTTVPATGVMPAQGYFSAGQQIAPLSGMGTADIADMFYTSADAFRDRLVHVYHIYTPRWLQIDVQIPIKTVQAGYQEQKVIGGVGTQWFGFRRGRTEIVHIPSLRYGWRWGNDTSMNVYANVVFYYGEYIIEIPDDPELIYDILVKRIPFVKYITLPIFSNQTDVTSALKKSYGFDGFELPRMEKRQDYVTAYGNLLSVAAI
jgi:hypothetical protein